MQFLKPHNPDVIESISIWLPKEMLACLQWSYEDFITLQMMQNLQNWHIAYVTANAQSESLLIID